MAPGSLTFSATTWNTAQTVTGGEDDTEVDGNMAWNVRLSSTSTDSNHNGVVRMVSMTTVDDAPIVVSRGTGALPLTEGSAATYTVRLKGQSASAVVVRVTSADAGALMYSATTWNTGQTVTMSATSLTVQEDPSGRGRTGTWERTQWC